MWCNKGTAVLWPDLDQESATSEQGPMSSKAISPILYRSTLPFSVSLCSSLAIFLSVQTQNKASDILKYHVSTCLLLRKMIFPGAIPIVCCLFFICETFQFLWHTGNFQFLRWLMLQRVFHQQSKSVPTPYAQGVHAFLLQYSSCFQSTAISF